MTVFTKTLATSPSDIQGFRKDGFDLAVEHVKAQRVIWEKSGIPIEHLFDVLLKNLAALREII